MERCNFVLFELNLHLNFAYSFVLHSIRIKFEKSKQYLIPKAGKAEKLNPWDNFK